MSALLLLGAVLFFDIRIWYEARERLTFRLDQILPNLTQLLIFISIVELRIVWPY